MEESSNTPSQKRIPWRFQGPDGNIALLVPEDDFDELEPPVISMWINGFMDYNGKIHYEFNTPIWRRQKTFLNNLKILTNIKKYYMNIPHAICEMCVTEDPKRLIGGGMAYFDAERQNAHLSFLGLKSRAEIPDVSPEFRKEAIFHFQKSYNRMVQWLGLPRTTTHSAIIPHERMAAIGWQLVDTSWKEYWEIMKGSFPAYFIGKIRAYEIKFD